MALIVTPADGGESLASVADADAYHDSRGNIAAWSPLETDRKEQLLRAAYDYLVAIYGAAWPLAVPFGTVDGVVPVVLVQASAILALRAKSGELMPEVKAQKTKVVVGPIETDYGPAPTLRSFPDIDRMFAAALALAVPVVAGYNPYQIPLGRS